MKFLKWTAILILINSCSPKASEPQIYEVGCGLCVYDVKEADECAAYAVIDGKAVPISGNVLDAHEVGLCEWKGKAYMKGKTVDGKFVAESMKIKEFDKSKNYQH